MSNIGKKSKILPTALKDKIKLISNNEKGSMRRIINIEANSTLNELTFLLRSWAPSTKVSMIEARRIDEVSPVKIA